MSAATSQQALQATPSSGHGSFVGVLLAAVFAFVSQTAPATAETPSSATEFLVRIQPHRDENGKLGSITAVEAKDAIDTLKKRLSSHGIDNAEISLKDQDHILLVLPTTGEAEAKRLRNLIEQPSSLNLHQVSPRSDEVGPDGKSLAQRVLEGTEIVPGYRAYVYKTADAEGNEQKTPMLLNRRAAVNGTHIAVAKASNQQAEAVEVTLNTAGTERMIALTTPMRGGVDRIAIVLDGEILSAPVVNQTPLGKNFIISGLKEPGAPAALAINLLHPLQNQLTIEQQTTRPSPGR